MSETTFTFPLDCLPAVGEVFSGQYALPAAATVSGTPSVLDIGANCGAFTLWARMMWPGCRVMAYEPQPILFAHLKHNLRGIPDTRAYNFAVGDPALPFLFAGQHSRLCSGQYQIGEQTADTIAVAVIEPEKLAPADIVKIDTEGAEGYIVERLPFTPAALILEWHGAENRRRVELALAGKMHLAAVRTLSTTTGIYCYLRA